MVKYRDKFRRADTVVIYNKLILYDKQYKNCFVVIYDTKLSHKTYLLRYGAVQRRPTGQVHIL